MPLPALLIDSLFARLTVRYGAVWTRMWEGLDMAAVKADWAECLAGFERRPRSIEYALDNLPIDRPPNAAQFARLCGSAPVVYDMAQLSRSKPSEEEKRRVSALLRQTRDRLTAHVRPGNGRLGKGKGTNKGKAS